MKNCELCNRLARIYCEPDHANLCWDCDLKVHSANFLVAKHSRSLLCHVCQSATAWSASGAKVSRTVSVCERCVKDEGTGREEEEEEEDDVEEEEEEENEDEDEEEIDLEDIQVVPWSSTPPPPPASSSSSGESLNSHGNFSLKRMREDDDDCGTSISHWEVSAPPPEEEHGSDEAAEFVDSFSTRIRTPSKIQRTEESLTGRVETTGCSATIEFVGRINRQQMNSSGAIAEFCEDLRAVDPQCSETL